MIDTKNEKEMITYEELKKLAIKKLLTINEAAVFSGIGAKTIRNLAHNNPIPEFVLYNGTKILIKRSLFEKWIDDPDRSVI